MAHFLYLRVIYVSVFNPSWDSDCLRAALSMALISPSVFWFYSNRFIFYYAVSGVAGVGIM